VKYSINSISSHISKNHFQFYFSETQFVLFSSLYHYQVNCQASDSRDNTRDQKTLSWFEIQMPEHREPPIYALL